MGEPMKQRFALLLTLAATLALVLPTSALAATPFRYSVTASFCEVYGGAYGEGFIEFNTKVKEIGVSGANYFRARTKMKMGKQDLVWTQSDTGWEYSRSFPNDADNWYRLSQAHYDFEGQDWTYAFRFVTRLQVWSNKKGLLSEVVLKSPWC